jgi:heme a synthase
MSASHQLALPLDMTSERVRRRFAVFAWLVLVFNIPVILWGAYVRVSYSGDGCGANWPFCNGQLIPKQMSLPTAIEYAHRVTTGIDTLLVLCLCVWAFLSFPRRAGVRIGAIASLMFLFIEALLGAGLVLFRLVAHDQSAGRVWYLSGHLANTLLLLAAMSITAWLAGTRFNRLRWSAIPGSSVAALAATLFVGITGAIAALGDTLFPGASLTAGLRQDVSRTSSALLHLRTLHPLFAVAGATYILWVAAKVLRGDLAAPLRRVAAAVTAITILQLAAGMLNLSLLAPVWMQLTHLFIADVMWIAVVLFALESARTSRPSLA